jgi:hypothetical protein
MFLFEINCCQISKSTASMAKIELKNDVINSYCLEGKT